MVIDPVNFTIFDSTFTVGSMETYDVPLSFNPDGEGIYNGSITFLSNDPDEAEFTVALHGAGDGLVILGVDDIPNDEGQEVGVHWKRDVFDGVDPADNILNYRIWREYELSRESDDPAGEIWINEYEDENGEIRSESWELVGEVPAQQFEEYAFTAPTLADSTEAGIPWTTFLVSAHTDDPLIFFETLPDSGYSIDNLAPSVPENLVATVAEDDAQLLWSHIPDADFNYYRVYSNYEVIGESIEPAFMDTEIPAWINIVYEISAVDLSGNESERSEEFVISRNTGDVNFDDALNIMDLVMIIGNILGFPDSEFDEIQLSAADSNYDGAINILDVVALVDIILYNEGGLSRVVSEAVIYKNNRVVNQSSDGLIAYEFTLQHKPGFELRLTDNAFIALSNTESEITRVMIVNPESERLFSSGTDFEILEVIAASGNQYIDLLVKELPDSYSLLPAYPNPFNPATNISYTLPTDSYVKVLVFDIQGRLVTELVNREQFAGKYSVSWNGSNQSSGMYLVQMLTPDFTQTQKILLLK